MLFVDVTSKLGTHRNILVDVSVLHAVRRDAVLFSFNLL